jgi:hypothetical protein
MAEISPLRRRMIEDMTVRNLSPATQQSYLNAVSKFSRYFGSLSSPARCPRHCRRLRTDRRTKDDCAVTTPDFAICGDDLILASNQFCKKAGGRRGFLRFRIERSRCGGIEAVAAVEGPRRILVGGQRAWNE